MVEVRQTIDFSKWLAGLKDAKAVDRINVRIRRLSLGKLGNVKPVGEGIGELGIDYGPGYRIYFIQQGQIITVLFCGGDKRTQDRDIVRAKRLAKEIL